MLIDLNSTQRFTSQSVVKIKNKGEKDEIDSKGTSIARCTREGSNVSFISSAISKLLILKDNRSSRISIQSDNPNFNNPPDNPNEQMSNISNKSDTGSQIIAGNYFEFILSNVVSANMIKDELLEMFSFSEIPKFHTMMSNIRIYQEGNISTLIMKLVNSELDILESKITGKFFRRKIKIYYSKEKTENYTPLLLGKIKSNLMENEFNVYKYNGKDKKKLLKVKYDINLCGIFGLRKMKVFFGKKGVLVNKLPQWCKELRHYSINFNNRVKVKSIKNFILEYEKETILQCGKIDENNYALDFKFPLSPFEAFAVAITSIISKLSCV